MIILDGIIFSIQKFGGITTYFNNLASGLSLRMKDQVQIWKYPGTHPDTAQKEDRTLRLIERYRDVDSVPANSILHSSYYRTSGKPGVRNVITVYDFTYEKYGKFPHKWIHGLQKKHAIKKADAIICISESTKMDLLYYFPEIPEERLFVTHLAASDCFFSFGTQSSSRFDEPYVLFVGARGGYKNFKSVVYALSAVPSVKLLFVGGGPITTEEGDLLNKLLSNRFQHMGSISSEQLNKLYNDALCLIYPSQYEGFGIPILEAMAADCPVIAANCSSIPEVANNCAVLLDTPDPEAIANAVKTMMDKDVNDRYVALGRENAKGFTWDKTVEKTIEIYSSL